MNHYEMQVYTCFSLVTSKSSVVDGRRKLHTTLNFKHRTSQGRCDDP